VAVKCPNCQHSNPDDTVYCGNCATALTQAGPPPPALTKTLESPAYVLPKGSLIAEKYSITEEIGRGGMGVVYKAEDMKLARKVAIKVLPEVFMADRERLARFEREARLLASLNHPNVAAIYGVEEAGGRRFLILELVEGETLTERLGRGALTLEETLEVCSQIAEGLEGAHEKGIIHRDLKPSNVKITSEGKVKILDFGLAKALHDQTSETDISESPTITADMTEPGVILGTAAYMSPEQATGRLVDKRVDIWAFGCILYECLTGRRAFAGATVTETIAAILRGEPDWDSLPAGTPGNVRAVLRRCLQKAPKERLRDIGDARIEIEAPAASPSETAPARGRFSLPWLTVVAAVMLLAGIFIGRGLIMHPQPPSSPSVITSTITVEPGHWLDGMLAEFERPTRTAMAISGDGNFIVYSAISENPGPHAKPQLYVRPTDQMKARPIPGTEGGISPFLSPDDRWLGFWSDGKLMKVPAEGGIPAPLGDVLRPFGATWGDDNSIVFSSKSESGLVKVSANGGEPEILTSFDRERQESGHRLPHFLPDGKGVLFTVVRHPWDLQPRVAVLEPTKRQWRYLLEDAADARYVASGHVVFLRQGKLMAVPFDLDRRILTGQPVPVITSIMQTLNTNSAANYTGAGQLSISDSGWLVYAPGGIVPEPENSLVWVDQKGVEQHITSLRAEFTGARLSPDGRWVVYKSGGRLWIYDISRNTASPLTSEGWTGVAIWTPDGKRVVFPWTTWWMPNLYWQFADGRSAMERLTTSETYQEIGSWSPDGTTLAFAESPPEMNYDILLLDLQTRGVRPFLSSRFDENQPEISPDGRWIAYSANESGRYEVYVQPFPGPGGKFQVSLEGGRRPRWTRNGKHLYYRWRNQVWIVDVHTESGFSLGKPRLLFEKSGYANSYDVSPDGQRFLMVRLDESKSTPVKEMILVQNWLEELKRLIPSGKK